MIKSRNIDLDKAFVNKSFNIIYPSINPKTATVTARTANATLTVDDFDEITTNAGDGDSQILTLPAPMEVEDMGLRVVVLAAFTIVLDPLTYKIYLNGSGVADKTLTIGAVVGNFLELYSDGTDYIVTNYSGVVTKET